MRTLVVSDLHLGARLHRDVLRRPVALDALLGALDGVDRLVLLGDVVELLEGRPRQALQAAEPVLRALGARLGAGGEIVVVPGNHDAALVRPWLLANGVSQALDAPVPHDATPALAHVTAWLGPARVEVRSPGVWLGDGAWATHGHYLDRHLLPESAFGIARGLLGRLPRDGATPADYERAGGPSLTHLEALLTRWLPRPLAVLADDLAEVLRAATMPGVPLRVLSHRHAPLTARLLGVQMRRASLPALARVVHRLRRRRSARDLRARPPPRTARGRRRQALGGAAGDPEHPQHRLLGLRAAAAAPGTSPAPLLAGRRGAPRGRPPPASHRPARPPPGVRPALIDGGLDSGAACSPAWITSAWPSRTSTARSRCTATPSG